MEMEIKQIKMEMEIKQIKMEMEIKQIKMEMEIKQIKMEMEMIEKLIRSTQVATIGSNTNTNSSNTNCETSGSKAKGGIIFATLTLMIYIATIAINIFLTFVAPAAYLILMTLQRLLITNLFLDIEDDSWERDWNLILIPIIDYVVFNWFKGNEMFKGQSPEDYSITGRKNRDIFGKLRIDDIISSFRSTSKDNNSNTINTNKLNRFNELLKKWAENPANLDDSRIRNATVNLSNLQGGSNGSNATLDIYKYFKEFLTTIVDNRIHNGSPLRDYKLLIKN